MGEGIWEEINQGAWGANYGWPIYEGPESDANFIPPIFAYGHGSTNTTGCAITGGAFYNPATVRFPSGYVGDYFFADYCNGWIRSYDPATETVSELATGLGSIVDLEVNSDGRLYYLSRGNPGLVGKIGYSSGY